MSFSLRRAMRLPQIRSQAASITQRRGLANAAGKDGAAKVHFWKQPLNPRNWKDNERNPKSYSKSMSFFLRRAMRLPQIRSQAASITQRRGLANAAGKDGAANAAGKDGAANAADKDGAAKVKKEKQVLVSLYCMFFFLTEYQRMRNRALEKLHNENKEIKISLMKGSSV